MRGGMSAARRGLCAAVATMAAMAALVAIGADPRWADQLITITAVGAGVTAWLLRAPSGVPRLRDWRLRREVHDLKADMAKLAAQVNAQGAEIAEAWVLRVQMDSLSESFAAAFGAAGAPAPEAVAADGPTQPIYLGDRRRAV